MRNFMLIISHDTHDTGQTIQPNWMLQQPSMLIIRQCVTWTANLIRLFGCLAARLHAKTNRIDPHNVVSCLILDYLWTTENDIVPIRAAHGMIQFSAVIKWIIRFFRRMFFHFSPCTIDCLNMSALFFIVSFGIQRISLNKIRLILSFCLFFSCCTSAVQWRDYFCDLSVMANHKTKILIVYSGIHFLFTFRYNYMQ